MNKKIIISIIISLIVMVIIYLIISSGKDTISTKTNNESIRQDNNSTVNNSVEENIQEETTSNQSEGIVINKKDITSTAKFYKYKAGNVNMEVMAVKASDGSIRTALNTCQVCYDSGRGYYKQQGNYLVCQNCGNKFSVDQIEKIKGGCNPVPVLAEDKTDDGNTITISKEYLESQKEFFLNWK